MNFRNISDYPLRMKTFDYDVHAAYWHVLVAFCRGKNVTFRFR